MHTCKYIFGYFIHLCIYIFKTRFGYLSFLNYVSSDCDCESCSVVRLIVTA